MIDTPSHPVFSYAEACDRGKKREDNQDHVRHVTTALGELLIVADGIGGYGGGAIASRMVVDSFETWFGSLSAETPPAQAIADAAAHANANIFEAAAHGDPDNARMGSTVVVALITQGAEGLQAWLGHVGDSRAYLCRAGQISRLTHDHSTVQALIDQGAIRPEEAASHPDRSVLLRSVGHTEQCEIEMSVVTLHQDDSLLLCSDGLWGFVAEEAMEQVLGDPGIDAQGAAGALLNLALEAGGLDNIGIELVRVGGAAPARLNTVQAHPGLESRWGGFGRILIYVLLVVAIGAAFGWYAIQRHWIPGIRHTLPSSPSTGN
ncbi:MAG TPA: protein phosphatase 2C domain-containing protein [Terracidiphilus sp.]|jgi:protein phosphatase